MPRRKQITIPIEKLSVYGEIIDEISENPLFEDYDLDTLKLTILKKKAPPRIKDVDKAIENLKWHIDSNSHRIEEVLGMKIASKKDLAKMMRISRPTLDKWITDDFIQPQKIAGTHEIFPVDAVLQQLEKQRKKK
jgi:hypothetical protein